MPEPPKKRVFRNLGREPRKGTRKISVITGTAAFKDFVDSRKPWRTGRKRKISKYLNKKRKAELARKVKNMKIGETASRIKREASEQVQLNASERVAYSYIEMFGFFADKLKLKGTQRLRLNRIFNQKMRIEIASNSLATDNTIQVKTLREIYKFVAKNIAYSQKISRERKALREMRKTGVTIMGGVKVIRKHISDILEKIEKRNANSKFSVSEDPDLAVILNLASEIIHIMSSETLGKDKLVLYNLMAAEFSRAIKKGSKAFV